MMEWIVGAALILAAGVLFLVIARKGRRGKGSLTELGNNGGGGSHDTDPGGEGKARDVEGEELQKSRELIRTILETVSTNIESLLKDNVAYGNAIERHKAEIQKAMAMAGLQELERMLMEEFEALLRTSATYRSELDEANSKVKVQQNELERLQIDVGTDFLTRVPNRRAFDTRIVEELERVKRHGSPFALVLVDVDHFKDVNDIYGHVAGDRVLRAIANVLEGERRACDFLARYGGEEFALILPETNLEGAQILAERLRTTILRARFKYEERSISITISLGIAEVRPAKDTVESLIDRADKALYLAKEEGRNRVETAVFEEE